jgi:DNA-binding NarL/FixJ family response regulator
MTANQQRCELDRSARLQRGLMTTVEADTVLLQSVVRVEPRAAPDPHASGMSIVLIDRRPWTRQCLSRWFQQGSCNLRVVSAGSAAELIDMSEAVENLHLIVFSIGSASAREPEVLGQVTRLRQHMPQVPLVLLADRDDVDDIAEAMAHGVRGFITTSMELLGTAAGIPCVAGGGAFVPANSLVRYAYSQRNGSRGGLGDAQKGAFESLTPRESAVLARLREGKSNKVIAHELDIREGTVKELVRRLLGKLHASNPTELALLARAQSAGASRPPGPSGSP